MFNSLHWCLFAGVFFAGATGGAGLVDLDFDVPFAVVVGEGGDGDGVSDGVSKISSLLLPFLVVLTQESMDLGLLAAVVVVGVLGRGGGMVEEVDVRVRRVGGGDN